MEVTEPRESPCLGRLGPPDPDPGLGAIPRVWGEPPAVKEEHWEWREGPGQVSRSGHGISAATAGPLTPQPTALDTNTGLFPLLRFPLTGPLFSIPSALLQPR